MDESQLNDGVRRTPIWEDTRNPQSSGFCHLIEVFQSSLLSSKGQHGVVLEGGEDRRWVLRDLFRDEDSAVVEHASGDVLEDVDAD